MCVCVCENWDKEYVQNVRDYLRIGEWIRSEFFFAFFQYWNDFEIQVCGSGLLGSAVQNWVYLYVTWTVIMSGLTMTEDFARVVSLNVTKWSEEEVSTLSFYSNLRGHN